MMRVLLPFLLTVLTTYPILGQAPQLSPRAEISVITCSPGDAIFEAFGHSGFWVQDPVLGIDYAYNYGVFDFDQPNFYLNFMKGHLLYKLDRSNFKDFVYYYIYFDRSVSQQVLNLDSTQKQRMFDYLEWNNRPENQEYLYDYYFDNCATKIRDVIEIGVDSQIVWNDGYATGSPSIRELQNSYLKEMPWGRLGINLAMGPKIDQPASAYEYMYLPEYVFKAVNGADITAGTSKKLLKETRLIHAGTTSEDDVYQSLWWLWLLAFLVVAFSVWHYNKGLAFAWFDVLLFLVAGIAGSVLLSLWLFTDHSACANNFNVLWLLPLHLPAAVVLPFLYGKQWLGLYFRISAIIIVLTIACWFFIPQQLLVDFLPLMLILLVRSAYIGFVPKVKGLA